MIEDSTPLVPSTGSTSVEQYKQLFRAKYLDYKRRQDTAHQHLQQQLHSQARQLFRRNELLSNLLHSPNCHFLSPLPVFLYTDELRADGLTESFSDSVAQNALQLQLHRILQEVNLGDTKCTSLAQQLITVNNEYVATLRAWRAEREHQRGELVQALADSAMQLRTCAEREEEEARDLQRQMAEAQQKVTDCQRQFEAEVRRREIEAKAMLAARTTVREEICLLRGQLEMREDDDRRLGDRLSELAAGIEELQAQHGSVVGKLLQERHEVQKRSETSKAAFRAAAGAAEAEKEGLEQEVTGLKGLIKAIDSHVALSENRVEQLQAVLERLQRRQQLWALEAGHKRSLEELRATNRAAVRRLKGLEAEVTEREATTASLYRTNEALLETVETARRWGVIGQERKARASLVAEESEGRWRLRQRSDFGLQCIYSDSKKRAQLQHAEEDERNHLEHAEITERTALERKVAAKLRVPLKPKPADKRPAAQNTTPTDSGFGSSFPALRLPFTALAPAVGVVGAPPATDKLITTKPEDSAEDELWQAVLQCEPETLRAIEENTMRLTQIAEAQRLAEKSAADSRQEIQRTQEWWRRLVEDYAVTLAADLDAFRQWLLGLQSETPLWDHDTVVADVVCCDMVLSLLHAFRRSATPSYTEPQAMCVGSLQLQQFPVQQQCISPVLTSCTEGDAVCLGHDVRSSHGSSLHSGTPPYPMNSALSATLHEAGILDSPRDDPCDEWF